jgi:hypothetical protein
MNGLMHRSKQHNSITSSARPRSVSGTVRPSGHLILVGPAFDECDLVGIDEATNEHVYVVIAQCRVAERIKRLCIKAGLSWVHIVDCRSPRVDGDNHFISEREDDPHYRPALPN